MTYYTKTFDVTPGNRVGSQALEDQFLLVQQGFASVETDFAAKAPTANPTLTGHVTVPTPTDATDATTKAYVDAADALKADLAGAAFSGAVTVQAPSASMNPATKAYVDATAFSSALPGQSTATAGMVPVSDGANASWASIPAANIFNAINFGAL